MVNTAPVVGRNAELWINNVKMGYAKGFSCGIRKNIIKDYVYGSSDPGVMETGNATYPFTCDMMWIDSTQAALVLAGTKITIIVAPEGSTPTGAGKITLSNAILSSWDLTMNQDGVVLDKVSGEGKTLAFSTY